MSINKIVLSEKKITIIIVITFIVIMLLGGYISFRFKDNHNNSIKNNVSNKNFTYTSELITLTSSNIMNKEKGLKSNAYNIRIYNNTREKIKYKIILKSNDISCSCTEKIPTNYIRYSFDGQAVKTLIEENQDIYSNTINGLSNQNIEIKLWIDESYDGLDEHYHGRFIVKKIE